MKQNKNIQVVIIPANETIFWGKACEDILKEEFKDYAQDLKDGGYVVEISSSFPLVDIKTIDGLITAMENCKRIQSANGAIKIINTAEHLKGEKIVNISLLCAEVNKERIQINNIFRQRIIEKHIENGVYITDPENTYIDFDAVIESGATIYQNNFITGKSIIKKGCMLMPNNNINSSTVCGNVVVASTLNGAYAGDNTTIGPNAYLRPGAKIGKNCKIGDFVEIKNAEIGSGTKVSHLAYVGDAVIGENCNIGCGTIFVNYNGKTKSKSFVGNNSFIGSNCNIIAPVTIGNMVFVAAGTTVTENLSDGMFCIGRVRAEKKKDLGKRYIE